MSFHLNETTPTPYATAKAQAAETHPTNRLYPSIVAASDVFNQVLFDGSLPPFLITLQRTRRAYGYFAGNRFANRHNPTEITDEIALNPSHFANRSLEQILSTLAHEMVHLWQHHFGHSSRWGYHNKEWARKMREIGLIPSATGQPGGKETGRRVSHYIAEEGPFAQTCALFLAQQEVALYQDRRAEDEDEPRRREREKKAASKTKFTCGGCGANAWGKPDLKLICEVCAQRMEATPQTAPDVGDGSQGGAEPRKFAPSLPPTNAADPSSSEPRSYSVRRKNRCPYPHRLRLSVTHRRVRKKPLFG